MKDEHQCEVVGLEFANAVHAHNGPCTYSRDTYQRKEREVATQCGCSVAPPQRMDYCSKYVLYFCLVASSSE